MPNAQFNPLATLASSARQLNEQANQVVKSLGDSFTQTTNQLLASAAQGLPPLPPLPGAQASNPGNSRGNPNGGNQFPQLPTPQQLIPAQALQAVSQVEDVLLPPGIPRPSQALLQAARPRRPAPAPEQPPPAQPAAAARADRIAGVSEIGARPTANRLRIKM
jgi:hypothetical protein